MPATTYQGWMAVIGVWLIATLLGVGLFAMTTTTESAVFAVLIGIVTFINMVFAVLDLSGGVED